MLLVDVLRTHETGRSLCYMLIVDVLRTHEPGMPSHVTCKKEICSLADSRFIFSALFSSSNSLVFPSIFPFHHAISFLSIVQIFLVLFSSINVGISRPWERTWMLHLFAEAIYHVCYKIISHRLKGFARALFDKFGPLLYLRRLPCIFLFSFSWPKVL